MVKLNHRVTTMVRRVAQETDRVRVYELADPDDWGLPPFAPGAHIDVHLPDGGVRQYSLCGDPAVANRYVIAVQREEAGRGGSARFQDLVGEGHVLPVSLPRNHFALAAEAPSHLMIAGGIGITPFLPMIAHLHRTGGAFDLHYCTRSAEATPFLGTLAPFIEQGAVRLHHSGGDLSRRLDLAGVLRGAAASTHIYCCGPAGMIRAVQAGAEGRAAETLHFEHFGTKDVAPLAGGEGFDVELARSGRTVRVQAGHTILAALREAGTDVEASCEGGVCLSCKVRYLAGVPIHRDLVMKPDERREFMTVCVSGSAGPRLVLDL